MDSLLNEPVGSFGTLVITLGHLALVLGAFIALVMLLLLLKLSRLSHERRTLQERADAERHTMETRFNEVGKSQAELAGRLTSVSELLATRQADLARLMAERMDGLGHRIGQSMSEQANNTGETLRTLHERLATIDAAQKNITELSQGVVQLQSILANKQTRGAFGQGRMEAIIQDSLPRGAYSFQHTLSNAKRPDCVVFLPNGAPSLVIDAKFPLEGWTAFREAANPPEVTAAAARFKTDVQRHVSDIRDKYFLAGETHETAFLFVPSESIFADLHERFEDVVQKAARQRVVFVSPSLLTLSIQVVQTVLRDARLREQAHLIHDEVMKLVAEVLRLDERVQKLSNHFSQSQRDIEQIQITTKKIVRSGERIGELDMSDAAPQENNRIGSPGAA